jgi:hypothetical protein
MDDGGIHSRAFTKASYQSMNAQESSSQANQEMQEQGEANRDNRLLNEEALANVVGGGDLPKDDYEIA